MWQYSHQCGKLQSSSRPTTYTQFVEEVAHCRVAVFLVRLWMANDREQLVHQREGLRLFLSWIRVRERERASERGASVRERAHTYQVGESSGREIHAMEGEAQQGAILNFDLAERATSRAVAGIACAECSVSVDRDGALQGRRGSNRHFHVVDFEMEQGLVGRNGESEYLLTSTTK